VLPIFLVPFGIAQKVERILTLLGNAKVPMTFSPVIAAPIAALPEVLVFQPFFERGNFRFNWFSVLHNVVEFFKIFWIHGTES
jgi:hypothetical protein